MVILLFQFIPSSYAADVTLAWDGSTDPEFAGYRAFLREEGKSYDYSYPEWEGSETTCTIYNLEDDVTYYFVVRAFDFSGKESGNSNEVSTSGDLGAELSDGVSGGGGG